MLTGENGILNQATNAKERTTKAEEEEKIKMAVLGSSVTDNGYADVLDTDSFTSELTNQFGNDGYQLVANGDGSFLITINDTQRKYYVNDDKTVINSDNITEISTEQQLKDFRDDVNNGNSYEGKVVLLTSDMDLGGEGWKPIGYYMPENVNAPNADNNKPFRGIFDGCGYEIDNFTINSTEKVQGLFGLVNGAKIANLGVGESASVSGEGVTGGVIAYAYNETKVNNCYSKASVKGTSSVGGIVGNSEKNSTVLNCYNSGSIEGTGTWIGGIVGQVQLESIVETSYNEGSVYGKSDNIGGIAGKLYINCIVRDCYNIGEITGDEDYIGGVVGHIQNSSAENCYNTGVINGNKATEINSVIGRINLSTVNNCYALEGQYSNETSGIKVLNSDELENAASFLGNKFKSNTTGINNNYYPILYWQ